MKPILEKKFKTGFIFFQLFSGGESRAKKKVLLLFVFVGGNKNSIQKKRENEFCPYFIWCKNYLLF